MGSILFRRSFIVCVSYFIMCSIVNAAPMIKRQLINPTESGDLIEILDLKYGKRLAISSEGTVHFHNGGSDASTCFRAVKGEQAGGNEFYSASNSQYILTALSNGQFTAGEEDGSGVSIDKSTTFFVSSFNLQTDIKVEINGAIKCLAIDDTTQDPYTQDCDDSRLFYIMLSNCGN